jgi:NADH-quinone oxidoreductase subunit C
MGQGEDTEKPAEDERPTQQRPEEPKPPEQSQPEDAATLPDTEPKGDKPGGGGTAASTAGDAPASEEQALAAGEKAQAEPVSEKAGAAESAPAAPSPPPAKREKPEAKPTKEPPPPGSIADVFKEALPDVGFDAYQGMTNVIIEVPRESVAQVMQTARDDPRLQLDFLRCLFGVDHEAEGMEVVYELMSYNKGHTVTLKTRLSQDGLRVASVKSVWNAADWHERETRDMFGIEFEGHPHLIPLLLPEDMTDHFPLRKDNPLAEIEEWQGEILGDDMGQAGHIPSGSKYQAVPSAEGEE